MARIGSQPVNNPGTDKPSGSLILLAAVLVLLYFGVLIYMLVAELGSEPDRWGRGIQLLQAFSAVALTATGFLFGREVNRKRADNAEQRAEAAHEREKVATVQAAQSASSGRALAAAIQAKASRHGGAPPNSERLEAQGPGDENQGILAADLEELADLSSRLFPVD